MENKVYKKFGWEIKLASLQNDPCLSVPVLIGDSKWRLTAYLNDHLCLQLEVVDIESLPYGWRKYVECHFTLVNQIGYSLSIKFEGGFWFDTEVTGRRFFDIIPKLHLSAMEKGFLMNGGIMITAEIEILDTINTSDLSQVQEISEDVQWGPQNPSSSFEALHNKDDVLVEINGFQVLDSQVNEVKTIFDKYPDLTSSFTLNNQDLKNACMNALLDVINTLYKTPTPLITEEDLNKADGTISDLIKAGFELEWLSQKLRSESWNWQNLKATWRKRKPKLRSP